MHCSAYIHLAYFPLSQTNAWAFLVLPDNNSFTWFFFFLSIYCLCCDLTSVCCLWVGIVAYCLLSIVQIARFWYLTSIEIKEKWVSFLVISPGLSVTGIWGSYILRHTYLLAFYFLLSFHTQAGRITKQLFVDLDNYSFFYLQLGIICLSACVW